MLRMKIHFFGKNSQFNLSYSHIIDFEEKPREYVLEDLTYEFMLDTLSNFDEDDPRIPSILSNYECGMEVLKCRK